VAYGNRVNGGTQRCFFFFFARTAIIQGLATCPVGYSKAGDDIIKQVLGIPSNYMSVSN